LSRKATVFGIRIWFFLLRKTTILIQLQQVVGNEETATNCWIV